MDPYAPSDSGLAKRLSFSPSPKASEKKRLEQWGNGDSTGKRSSPFHPHQSPTRRDPLHSSGTDLCDHHPPPSPPRPFPRRQKARRRSGVGFCGALIFLFLCLTALALICWNILVLFFLSLRPTERERNKALVCSMADILWRAGGRCSATIAL